MAEKTHLHVVPLVPSGAVDRMLAERRPEVIRSLAAHGDEVALCALDRLDERQRARQQDEARPLLEQSWRAQGIAINAEDGQTVAMTRGPAIALAIVEAHNAALGSDA